MTVDQDNLRRKNEELTQAYKEKNRKLLQTQELYDKLKRKAMLGQIQDAASDAVDTTLQNAAASGTSYADQIESQGLYEHQMETPYRGARYSDRADHQGPVANIPRAPVPDIREDAWARQAGLQGECGHDNMSV